MAGGGNKKFQNKTKSRRKPKKASTTSLFVQGGLLSDWSPLTTGKTNSNSKSGHDGKKKNNNKSTMGTTTSAKSKPSNSDSHKPKNNAFAYTYPQPHQGSPFVEEGGYEHRKWNESNPIVLLDSKKSKIIAYMDETPVTDSVNVKYTYEYGATFEVDDPPHMGLGFHNVAEEKPIVAEATTPVIEREECSRFDSTTSHEMETDMMDDDDDDDDEDASNVDASASPVTNSGFLSIGGMKLYTHDISCDDDDDDDDEVNDDGREDHEESLDSSASEFSSKSSDSDGAYNSFSDLDDEIAKDYFEGIGGIYQVANVDGLIGQVLDSSDDDDGVNAGRFNQMLKGVSGIALQEASRQYGKKKPRSNNKERAETTKYGTVTDDWSAIDDLMFVKNSRSLYGKKKHAAKLPQSWPSKAEKSKNFQRFSGEKKKHRQDKIACKRRERSRGVDLEKINYKLEQMVKNKADMMSFQLIHSRDCSQVQRLAAIYRLHSGSQGSGKKRFVTVTRTQHTGMPSLSDRVRIEKLLRVNDDGDNDMIRGKTPSSGTKKAGLSPLDSKSAKSKTSGESSKKKRGDKDKTGLYAAQPVSFISSGNMVTEPAKMNVGDQILSNDKPVANSPGYGAFEMHTTGFGSRMMAKMGYVDGGGLGKDGRGIAEPIEAIQRPKSLGLGAKVPETSKTSEPMYATPPPQRRNRPVGQGSNSESRGKSVNVQIGSFEKHTKGFGSKMMAKMGFVEGMGLGRDSQGIVQPLVANRLPKSRGLGAKG